MADVQAYSATAQHAASGWGAAPMGSPEAIASAAAEARRRAAQGFTTSDFRLELKRTKRARAWKRFGIVIGVIAALVAAAAVTVILVFSVNQVNSSSMVPVLQEGQMVVSNKSTDLGTGDVLAYRDGDAVTFGRVIAKPGNWVNILSDNTLVVSDVMLDNSTAKNYASSNAPVKVSRQVPSDSYFVLGDSEIATIAGVANSQGFVKIDQVIGKSLFKIWPISNIGAIV